VISQSPNPQPGHTLYRLHYSSPHKTSVLDQTYTHMQRCNSPRCGKWRLASNNATLCIAPICTRRHCTLMAMQIAIGLWLTHK
jgi:hypothetical protein